MELHFIVALKCDISIDKKNGKEMSEKKVVARERQGPVFYPCFRIQII